MGLLQHLLKQALAAQDRLAAFALAAAPLMQVVEVVALHLQTLDELLALVVAVAVAPDLAPTTLLAPQAQRIPAVAVAVVETQPTAATADLE